MISHFAAEYLALRSHACLPIAKGQLEMAKDVIAISQKNLDILHNFSGLAKNKAKAVLFVLNTMLDSGLPQSVMETVATVVATVVNPVNGIAGLADDARQLSPDPDSQPNATVRALADAFDTLARDIRCQRAVKTSQ